MISRIRRFFRRELPLINHCIPSPKNIWLADSLIPLHKAESIFKISWTEMILGKKTSLEKYLYYATINNDNLPDISCDELAKRAQEIAEKCAVRWLGDELGWALVLKPGRQLEKGFLCLYAGSITTLLLQHASSYAEREFFLSLFKTDKEDIGIDAKHNGNLARFLPFLLEQEHLIHFDIDLRIKDKIATANLKFQKAVLQGVLVPCVYNPETITAPHDQEILLGVNYSLDYLSKMENFKLINKDNLSTLDATFYSQKMVQITLEGLSYSFSLSRLRLMAAKNFPELRFKTVGYDEEKNEYYEISVSDAELYQAAIKFPEATHLTVKPMIKKISREYFLQISKLSS